MNKIIDDFVNIRRKSCAFAHHILACVIMKCDRSAVVVVENKANRVGWIYYADWRRCVHVQRVYWWYDALIFGSMNHVPSGWSNICNSYRHSTIFHNIGLSFCASFLIDIEHSRFSSPVHITLIWKHFLSFAMRRIVDKPMTVNGGNGVIL